MLRWRRGRGERRGSSGETAPRKAEVLCVEGPVSSQDGVGWDKDGEVGCVGLPSVWGLLRSWTLPCWRRQ